MTHHNPQPFIPAEPAANLPAIIDALPPDSERAPQVQFDRGRQAQFLKRLADTGEVRVAARGAAVSHQTVYRLRRACAVFRRGMDAALLVARDRAEEMLASRALHGVEEKVYYHGEVVATRRRYDSRLLLAHLARLDRLEQREDVAALAEDFDTVIAAFEDCVASNDEEVSADNTPVLPEHLAQYLARHVRRPEADADTGSDIGSDIGERCEAAADVPSGPCNMRSMSPAEAEEGAAERGEDGGAELPSTEARLQAMEAARPEDAQSLREVLERCEEEAIRRGDAADAQLDIGALEWAQLAAFEAGVARWWDVGLGREGRDEEAGEEREV